MPEEGWVVEGTGLRELYLGDLARENMSGVFLDVAVYPGGRTQRAEGVYGTVTRRTLTEHHILTEGEEAEGFFGNAWDSSELVPDQSERVQCDDLCVPALGGDGFKPGRCGTPSSEPKRVRRSARLPRDTFGRRRWLGNGVWFGNRGL